MARRRLPLNPRLPVLVATLVLAAACANAGADAVGTGEGAAGAAPSTELPTTVAPSGRVGPPIAPYTGILLTGDGVARMGQRALVVKIDNDPPARPQSGLNQADIVFELEVEGITRFAALFHSRDASPVGPVRSARSSDVQLLANLGTPLFAWSGANPTVTSEVATAQFDGLLLNLAEESIRDLYWRDGGRNMPYNLYTDSPALRDVVPEAEGPGPGVFTYRQEGESLPAGSTAVAGVDIAFAGDGRITATEFVWDAERKGWARFQDDFRHDLWSSAHRDADGVVVAPENVVILFIDYRGSAAGRGSPQAVTVGSGPAIVLTAGQAVEGRWKRDAAGDPYRLRTPDGDPIALTPGRTWVALPERDSVDYISAERAELLLSTLG